MELGNEPLAFRSDAQVSAKTAARISSTYDTSIVVRRWGATWIDFAVLASFLMLPDWLLGNELYQRTMIIWLSLLLLYIPMCEWLFGRTLGKLVVFIQVVDENGNKPSIAQVIVRTLLRIIEVNPLLLGGIPAGIAVLMSKHRQRLGDMAAKTYVLKSSDANALRRTVQT